MRTLRFGIEIETIGRNRSQVANAIQSIVGGAVTDLPYGPHEVTAADGRTWSVMADSSLSAPEHLQAEIVSPILRYGDIETLQNVIRAVRKIGARVDATCGIHYARAVVMRSPSGKPTNNRRFSGADCA